jgi:nitroreductase
MDVKQAIEARRAYRSLEHVGITGELINDLAGCARLAPSCYNNQPWRFVFVHEPEVLKKLHAALSSGNEWAKAASMIIVVFSKKDDDCVIREREYNLFDTGMATAFIMLRATELGLVAHPIAGYSPKKVREVLGIPEEYNVITLVNVGKHSDKIPDYFAEHQVRAEKERPERKPLEEFVYFNRYGG